jgi:integron integrase
VAWIRRFVLFHHKRHPREMGGREIEAFLTDLAVRGKVAASTQNQALSALLFLFKQVLEVDAPDLGNVVRAKRPQRLPVVLTREEVQALLSCLKGTHWLMGVLLYGSGLRLLDCLRLRVKDVAFGRNEIVVCEGKGDKDGITMLPEVAKAPLQAHLERVRELHEKDIESGYGEVYLPHALDRKYPSAARELAWQWVFPSTKLSVDPRSGVTRRHHADESGLQKALRQAGRCPRCLRCAVRRGECERQGDARPNRGHVDQARPAWLCGSGGTGRVRSGGNRYRYRYRPRGTPRCREVPNMALHQTGATELIGPAGSVSFRRRLVSFSVRQADVPSGDLRCDFS